MTGQEVSPAYNAASLSSEDFVDEAEIVPFDRDKLASHLQTCGLDYDPTMEIQQFAGGFANRNYLVEVDGRPAILRRPPAGVIPRGAHDMAREHRILSALAPALPFVPGSLHFCADPAVIGAPFQLIEYRGGVVLRGAALPANIPADRGDHLSALLIETLAAIHAVDTTACGLGDLGRPAGFLDRSIKGWRDRGEAVTDSSDVGKLVDDVGRWLAEQKFTDRPATLLHLDFKLDNIILDPVGLTPNAVIDWDMGTRGDRLFDLATLLSYWTEAGDSAELIDCAMMPTAQLGFWTRKQAAQRYADLTSCDLSDLPALQILAIFKLGVVFLQLHRQWATGVVKGERYGAFRDRAISLLHHAHDLVSGKDD
ncbi:phosphotransferase family protein (plasmid) [Rhizorhabdus wittichii DC-6]|nr:phosphotransferase family protein [Rhizorhabdus wittichii DC-6]